MKLADKIKELDPSTPYFTLEFFPPRTQQGFENLTSRISRLSELNPLGINITWGAGGSTKDRSLDLAGLTQRVYGIDTVMHLTCTNMERGMVHEALTVAKQRGIENILALRGDPPRGQEEWIPVDPQFQHGVDLVKYIRSTPEFATEFCIGVGAYPEGHPDSQHGEEIEIKYLKEKVDAGADFIVTQLFYDVDRFIAWLKKVREAGITVPIIPCIMPIQTYSSFMRLTKLTGIKIPSQIMDAIAPISNDDQAVKDYGITLAVDMIRRLVSESEIRGFNFCTLNLERSVTRILEILQWTGAMQHIHNKLITDKPKSMALYRLNGNESDDFVVTPTTATNTAAHQLARLPKGDGESARGEVNSAATWDEFPNGRFGDFKSPAFGNTDQWGGQGAVRTDAVAQWGHPKSLDDLTNLFLAHLHGEIETTPFSPTPLSPESLKILDHLEQLTKKSWWTVGSQPAVDGAKSDDEVFGWGPGVGYVFQKGFIEFFCDQGEVDAIERRIEKQGKGWVHWFAGNYQGECRSNVPEGGRNAVTWGVFPGQEIAQTTIIEKESFLSWKEEAFAIWSDWAMFYRPESEERKLLEGIRDRRWLVSIVHHDYRDPEALWTFLFSEES